MNKERRRQRPSCFLSAGDSLESCPHLSYARPLCSWHPGSSWETTAGSALTVPPPTPQASNKQKMERISYQAGLTWPRLPGDATCGLLPSLTLRLSSLALGMKPTIK